LQKGTDIIILDFHEIGAFPQICDRPDQHYCGIFIKIPKDNQHPPLLSKVSLTKLDRKGHP